MKRQIIFIGLLLSLCMLSCKKDDVQPVEQKSYTETLKEHLNTFSYYKINNTEHSFTGVSNIYNDTTIMANNGELFKLKFTDGKMSNPMSGYVVNFAGSGSNYPITFYNK